MSTKQANVIEQSNGNEQGNASVLSRVVDKLTLAYCIVGKKKNTLLADKLTLLDRLPLVA